MQFKSFPEASHFREHLYIPHERSTICLDFTMQTSHCSASISHSCSAHIFQAYIRPGYVFYICTRHKFNLSIYSIYSEHIILTPRRFHTLARPGQNGIKWFAVVLNEQFDKNKFYRLQIHRDTKVVFSKSKQVNMMINMSLCSVTLLCHS